MTIHILQGIDCWQGCTIDSLPRLSSLFFSVVKSWYWYKKSLSPITQTNRLVWFWGTMHLGGRVEVGVWGLWGLLHKFSCSLIFHFLFIMYSLTLRNKVPRCIMCFSLYLLAATLLSTFVHSINHGSGFGPHFVIQINYGLPYCVTCSSMRWQNFGKA